MSGRCVAPKLSGLPGTLPRMSRRNREKRAAKQKLRQRTGARGPSPGPTTDGPPDQAEIAAALLGAARSSRGPTGERAARLLAEFGRARALDPAADAVLTAAVRTAWEAGWLPSDLPEMARRTLDPPVVDLLLSAIVFESRRYPRAVVHPRWQAVLDGIVRSLGYEVPPGALLRAWADRHGRSRQSSTAALLGLLAFLDELPVLERLLPLPGAQQHTGAATSTVDGKVLARVRALLAKAESTQFPDEAEALSAKAQELMSRYSLHRAVQEHDRGQAPAASGRRIWMDAPYAGAKVLLVQVVAAANRCRTVWRSDPGFVTVLGPDTELDVVELLTTSLLLQAGRAMLAAGRQTTRAGTSRTRSFRQSFLVAYAGRIGERLASADTAAATGTDAVPQERLLPVLAARSRATDEMTDRLFPRVLRRPVSVSNSAGWSAGRAAADQARFDVHSPIAG
jgi:Protein of unknown function (DUF2786)